MKFLPKRLVNIVLKHIIYHRVLYLRLQDVSDACIQNQMVFQEAKAHAIKDEALCRAIEATLQDRQTIWEAAFLKAPKPEP